VNAKRKTEMRTAPLPRPAPEWLNEVKAWLDCLPSRTSVTEVPELLGAVGSSTGSVRKTNEDRTCIAKFVDPHRPENTFALAIVCDGIGGLERGGDAATLAIAATIEYLVGSDQYEHDSNAVRLSSAISYANQVVYEELHGAGGTTLCCFMMSPVGYPMGVSVGDSRLYGLGADGLLQLSVDDTIGQELANLRNIRTEAIEALEFSDDLSQFVGSGADLRLDAHLPELESIRNGVIVASDGVWKMLGPTFPRIAKNSPSMHELVRRGIQASLWCGGLDNASLAALGTNAIDGQVANVSRNTLWIWAPQGLLRLDPERDTVRIARFSKGQHSARVSEPRPEISREEEVTTLPELFPHLTEKTASAERTRRSKRKKSPIRLQVPQDGRNAKKP